jgi:hypothetical protein
MLTKSTVYTQMNDAPLKVGCYQTKRAAWCLPGKSFSALFRGFNPHVGAAHRQHLQRAPGCSCARGAFIIGQRHVVRGCIHNSSRGANSHEHAQKYLPVLALSICDPELVMQAALSALTFTMQLLRFKH